MLFDLEFGEHILGHGMRIGQRLAEAQGHAFQAEEIGVYLTDTLEDPSAGMAEGLFGDARVLAEAAEAFDWFDSATRTGKVVLVTDPADARRPSGDRA